MAFSHKNGRTWASISHLNAIAIAAIAAINGVSAPAGGFTPVAIGVSDNYNDASFNTTIFNATTALPSWEFNTIGGSRVEGSGVLTCSTTASSDTTQGFSTVNTYDFSPGRSTFIHVVQAATDADTTFGCWIGGGEFVRFLVSKRFGSNFINVYKNNFSDAEFLWGDGSGAVSYDSTAHAWWCIHVTAGGLIQVYTAPNSGGSPGTWTLRGTSATPNFALTALRVGAFVSTNHVSPGNAIFDGFNVSD